MVCVYCGSSTRVTNSRRQRNSNSIWRRRVCNACAGIFTTEEHIALQTSWRFESKNKTLLPFNRDALFVSLLDCCRHRADALQESASLATLVIRRLTQQAHDQPGLISREALVKTTHQTLLPFDETAAALYYALHKPIAP